MRKLQLRILLFGRRVQGCGLLDVPTSGDFCSLYCHICMRTVIAWPNCSSALNLLIGNTMGREYVPPRVHASKC
jgi:hypothetical protein